MQTRLLLFTLSSALIGCSAAGTAYPITDPMSDGALPDSGELDASADAPSPDASVPDASAPDANVPDASLPDGSLPDGSIPDGSPADASAPDGSLPDGSLPDGSLPDGSPADASPPDAMPECFSFADCDDGLACNGLERCNAGRCEAGSAIACDDGIACTDGSCVDTAGGGFECPQTGVDSRCAAGERCDLARGCVSICSESPCRLVSPQCGCGMGQGCYLSGATRTCAAAGATAVGAGCTTASDCTPGSGCLNVSRDPTRAVNMCLAHCDTDTDCPAGGVCGSITDSAGAVIPMTGACSLNCNLMTGGGCLAGSRCAAFGGTPTTPTWHTNCTGPIGTGGSGAACTDVSGCQPGLSCVGMRCLRWCTNPGVLGTAGGCLASQACFGFTSPITISGVTYGVCDMAP